MIWNAWFHDPHVGYDAGAHLQYVEVLAGGRLPTPDETREYFSPPAPYAIPALLRATGVSFSWVGKLAQALNVLFSALLFVGLFGICERVRPGNGRFQLAAVCLLGMLPVYYKSFTQVRGEPILACFAVLAVLGMLSLFAAPQQSFRRAGGIGVLFGIAVLARQWGFFLLPAVALFGGLLAMRGRTRFAAVFRMLVVVGAATAVVGGWFYVRHLVEFGSVTTFNRAPESFSLSNQPSSFYLGHGDGELFSTPVREAFPNQFWPIFYSEVWGDYWSFFTLRQPQFGPLRGGRPIVDSNRAEFGPYLGRVNAWSLLPSLVFAAALAAGFARLWRTQRGPVDTRAIPREDGLDLLWLVVACSLLGYAWFLIRYPILDRGDTIKATYMLQIFPFLAILGAERLEWLWARSRGAHAVLVVALACVAVHNAPALFTRYPAEWPDLPLRVGELEFTPEAAEGPPGGIAVEFFAGQAFGDLLRSGIDRGLDMRALAAPIPGVPADNFSARWQGQLFFPSAGRYWLCSESDEGARVRFGGRPLIDDWGPHARRRACEAVRVDRGWYSLAVEYREGSGPAFFRLERGRDRRRLSPVPAAHLCCRGGKGSRN